MIQLEGTAKFQMAIKQYWEEVEGWGMKDFVCREAPHYHIKLTSINGEPSVFEMKGRIHPWDAKDLLCKEPAAIDLLKVDRIIKQGLDFEAECVKRVCELEKENAELKWILEGLRK